MFREYFTINLTIPQRKEGRKMTKDNATPRPWKVSDLNKCRIVADDNAGRYVAITYHDMLHNTEMNEANAQLIVKAVNCHDELVEALKLSYRSLTIDSDMEKDFAVEIKKIKQALAKAESDPIK